MDEYWNIKYKDFYTLKTNEDKIRFLLRFAILAPSTHNTQPWLFKIEDSSCLIYADPKFKLPQADKTGRDFYISFGCLIENLITASKYFKVFKSAKYFNKENLIAKIEFINLENSNKVENRLEEKLRAIPKRVTARGIFENKKIDKKIINDLKNIEKFNGLEINIIDDEAKIEKLASLTARGLKIAYKNPKFRHEMSGWVNSNFSKRKEGIPGYSLRLPDLMSLIFPTLVRFKDVGEKVSKLNYASLKSAPLVCVITSKTDSTENWLNVGRLAESAMLELNKNGVKTSIFVASIEMQDLYKEVQNLLQTKSRPQFLFCAGFMKFNQKHTPRHPLDDKIIN